MLKSSGPDYLVIQHLEPDHAGSIGLLAEKYPEMVLVGNAPEIVFANVVA